MFQSTVEASMFVVSVFTGDAKKLVYLGFRSVWGFNKHTWNHKSTDICLDLNSSHHCAL